MAFDGTKIKLAVNLAAGLGQNLWAAWPAYFNTNAAADADTRMSIIQVEAYNGNHLLLVLASAFTTDAFVPAAGDFVRLSAFTVSLATNTFQVVEYLTEYTDPQYNAIVITPISEVTPTFIPEAPEDPQVQTLGPVHLSCRGIVAALAQKLPGMSAQGVSDLFESLLTNASATWALAGVGPQDGHRTLLAGGAALIAENLDAYLDDWLETQPADDITEALALPTLS